MEREEEVIDFGGNEENVSSTALTTTTATSTTPTVMATAEQHDPVAGPSIMTSSAFSSSSGLSQLGAVDAPITPAAAAGSAASTHYMDTTSPFSSPPPSAASTTTPINNNNNSKSSGAATLTVDQARQRLATKLESKPSNNAAGVDDKDSLLFDSIQLVLKDHDVLKDKVSKLKSLLGRSAKAQREAKVDLEATQKRLDQALREIDRLNQKIEKLANRPTHMELLADFEANFDRALLSVGGRHQAGGEDTAPPSSSSMQDSFRNSSHGASSSYGAGSMTANSMTAAAAADAKEAAALDGMLMQELSESKQRIDKLEHLNAALVHRSSQLEEQVQQRLNERDALVTKISHLELEKRMAVMEAEHAIKAMQEKAASLEEMQMEIDLVTKASMRASAKAAVGEEMMKKEKTERHHIQQLEAKVQALQEWALASSEAKTLAQERVRVLEQQLRSLQQQKSADSAALSGVPAVPERTLFSNHGSFVIGAGDVGIRVFSLPVEQVKSIRLSERVILRWKFDLTSEDNSVPFSIMRGTCETVAQRRNADYIIKNRVVKGGAAGETENAFTAARSCTLAWDNSDSWIRPKTIRYTVSAVVIAEDD